MSAESVRTEVAPVEAEKEQKASTEERNFVQLRKKAERAEQLADQERAERLKLQEEVERLKVQRVPEAPEEDFDFGSEPYVDAPRLKKLLTRFEQKNEERIEKKAQEIARKVLEEERQRDFEFRLKSEYRDYDEVVNDESIERLKATSPMMARKIALMPTEYEKHAFAYEAIKMASLHRKPEASVKERVEQNLKNPYYMPSTSGPGSAMLGDFSEAGQKAAYERVKALKAQRRG